MIRIGLLLLASLPVGHQIQTPVPLVPEVKLVQAPLQSNMITFYDDDQHEIAKCDIRDQKPVNCKIEDGHTLDEVVAAMLRTFKELDK